MLTLSTLCARYAECDGMIAAFKAGKLALQAGMSMDASLESSMQGLLSGIRTKAADECMRTLAHHNSPLIMSQCGSKGSPVNIAQMVACVGQQVRPCCRSAVPQTITRGIMSCRSARVPCMLEAVDGWRA